jgi:hypothetical protein
MLLSESFFLGRNLHLPLLLSRQLQSPNQDLLEAMRLANDALKEFEEMQQVTKKLSSTFRICKEVCSNLGIEIKVPRYNNRQMNRFNLKTGDAEAYYRISFYILFLTHILLILKSVFRS